MNRRTLLSGVGLSILLPFGGCISDGTRVGNTKDEPDSGEDNKEIKNGSTDGEDSNEKGSKDESPISEQFDCKVADRPEPDVAEGVEHEIEEGGETTVYKSVGSTEYPTPPSEFDAATVRTFIEEHEKAYQQNDFVDRLGDTVVDFEVMIEETELFDYHDEITTVRLDFAVDYKAVYRGMIEMTEPVVETVVYAVDETGLVRTETDGPVREGTPDPLKDGQLLVCF